MAVRIVTDSASDIPAGLARRLGITVVPNYVVLEGRSYRDGVDIGPDEFYGRLAGGLTGATTSAPSPHDFAGAYRALARETDEIVSIHITARLSGVCDSARLGARALNGRCRVEVVDSLAMSVGLGLCVTGAAREAGRGLRLPEVAGFARRASLQIHNWSMADSPRYAVRSGRLNRLCGLMGCALGVKPILGMRQGEVHLAGMARTKARALDSLCRFAAGVREASEIALGYTTDYGDARGLADRLAAGFPGIPITVFRVGAVIGAHGGPGAIGIGIREGRG